MIQFDEHIFQMGRFNHQVDIFGSLFPIIEYAKSIHGSDWALGGPRKRCVLGIRVSPPLLNGSHKKHDHHVTLDL